MTAFVSNDSSAETASDTDLSKLTDTAPNSRATIGVRWFLIAAVVLMVIPAWSFAAYVSWQYAVTKRQVIEAAGRSTARTVASAIDFRLNSVEAAMATLSMSAALRGGDIATFYRDADALAKTQRVVVALASPSGEQIFNTNAPFGQALPPTAPEARFAEAVATQKIQFSNMIFGNVTKRWLVTIAVPVVRDNLVDHVLIVGLDTVLHLGEVLAGFDMPATWTVAILDEANAIAARRPFQERFIGQTAHPDVYGVITAAEDGSGRGKTITGEPVQIYYARLRRAPWTTLVGIPEADVDGSVSAAVTPVIMIGILVLLTSLLTAWTLGRRFTDQLVLIANYASAFRSGQGSNQGSSQVVAQSSANRITELAELATTLQTASDERTRYEQRLKGLLADKDMLMQEVHHRVKNSLQLVRGVLSLQARNADEPGTKTALLAAASRIMTVADVHQHLYQGHSTAEINVGRYVTDLAANLATSLLPAETGRRIVVDADNMIWPSEKVTTLGLIITELVTNAIKYGDGTVTVLLKVEADGQAQLVVEDEGSGFPEGFNLGQGSGLGSKLVTSLVRSEEGSVMIDQSVPFGRVVLTFMSAWRNDERD